jgi:hypothetical protein
MEPKRLLDGGGTELERLLLASGRAERPSSRAKWRTALLFFLVNVGVVSRVKGAAFLGSGARAWTFAHWFALSLGVGAAALGAAHLRTAAGDRVGTSQSPSKSPSLSASPLALALVEPSPSAISLESAAPPPAIPNINAPPSPLPSRSHGSAGSRVVPASPSVEAPSAGTSIASEIRELEVARQALASGTPRPAIDRLDRYDRQFPKGALQQEALRLRIEAMQAAGDPSAARSLARKFRALYPDSAHSKRLKSLLSDP